MTDLYYDPFEQPTPTPKWHQRRGSKVAIAGGVTAALAFVGLGISAASSAAGDPRLDLVEAAQNLKELPSSVTLAGLPDHPGTFTLTVTEDGAGLSVDSTEDDTSFDVLLLDDRLFVRLDAAGLGGLAGNPMAAMMVARYPSVVALLDGEWVSLDVSADSKVLAALRALSPSKASDQEALQTAAEELRGSLQEVADSVRGPLKDSLQDNATVTKIDDATGPEGSDHYQVRVDREAVRTDLEPTLREAFDQVLAAVDSFVADAEDQLPDQGSQWQTYRSKIVSAFDKALAKPIPEGDGADVWIADGEFTQITTHGATLTFEPHPTLEAPAEAVSMDRDLLRLLPMLENFANSQQLSSLGIAS